MNLTAESTGNTEVRTWEQTNEMRVVNNTFDEPEVQVAWRCIETGEIVWKTALKSLLDNCIQARQERDELIADLHQPELCNEKILRLEQERDEERAFIEELVDLVAYGLGQNMSVWSQAAMRKAREAIAKAKTLGGAK